MFTGIVQAVGHIADTLPQGDGSALTVATGTLDLSDVAVGDSIAVSGCCLTVTGKEAGTLSFFTSAETLLRTAGFTSGADVNLEKSLRLSDRLGGHLVQGHVDGVGTVARFDRVGDEFGSWLLEVELTQELARFVAAKGSIAVDGVSLTTNAVRGLTFQTNLIPHTLQSTTLHRLRAGSRVNIEVDVVARYIARLHEAGGGDGR